GRHGPQHDVDHGSLPPDLRRNDRDPLLHRRLRGLAVTDRAAPLFAPPGDMAALALVPGDADDDGPVALRRHALDAEAHGLSSLRRGDRGSLEAVRRTDHRRRRRAPRFRSAASGQPAAFSRNPQERGGRSARPVCRHAGAGRPRAAALERVRRLELAAPGADGDLVGVPDRPVLLHARASGPPVGAAVTRRAVAVAIALLAAGGAALSGPSSKVAWTIETVRAVRA